MKSCLRKHKLENHNVHFVQIKKVKFNENITIINKNKDKNKDKFKCEQSDYNQFVDIELKSDHLEPIDDFHIDMADLKISNSFNKIL